METDVGKTFSNDDPGVLKIAIKTNSKASRSLGLNPGEVIVLLYREKIVTSERH